jgi:hypothetical protein
VNFNGNTDWIRFVGRDYNGEHNEVNQRQVTSDYFATLRAKLLRGRTFLDSEDKSKPLVVVINQTLATKYFPGEDPIGKRFGDTELSPASIKEIIGIVDDIREGPLEAEIWPAVIILSINSLISTIQSWSGLLRQSSRSYQRLAMQFADRLKDQYFKSDNV